MSVGFFRMSVVFCFRAVQFHMFLLTFRRTLTCNGLCPFEDCGQCAICPQTCITVSSLHNIYTIQKSGMIHWKENMKSLFTINRSLLPIKLTIFLFSSSAFSLLPYLTIHMTDIGITVDQVAIIYAILPFTGLSF